MPNAQKETARNIMKSLRTKIIFSDTAKKKVDELLDFSQFFYSFSQIRNLTAELIQPNPRFEVRLKNQKNDPEKPESHFVTKYGSKMGIFLVNSHIVRH